MGKKCIPGVICIENMTLFAFVFIFVVVLFLYYNNPMPSFRQNNNNNNTISTTSYLLPTNVGTRSDPFNDPYAPPLKNDGIYFPLDSGDIRGGIPNSRSMINVSHMGGVSQTVAAVPVNVQTRSYNPEYTQIGILNKEGNSNTILPLMGRRVLNGRDKYQYYAISNTGSLNTKLPIKSNGRSCTSEYGCDQLYSNDVVYVEGYKETFNATIYENALLNYIPVI